MENFELKTYTIQDLANNKKIKNGLISCFKGCINQIKDKYPENDGFVSGIESFEDTLNTLNPEHNIFYIAITTQGELLGALWLFDQGTHPINDTQHRIVFSKFLGVSQSFQGKGCGTAIKSQLIDIMKKEEKNHPYYFYSTVKENNEYSKRMNEKLGMTNRGETESGSGTIQYGIVID